ncbi:MAG TPA: DsbA family oxidoreductase [Solirubrobacteraceae bacterium]|nr:DsbA family oxidoreductase [Solirubrobacteraceae bacterium]
MELEIWSDIACPWCYVGKRRFEEALSRFEHAGEVQLNWRSFELDPDAPHERTGDRAVRLAEKYGMSVERARELEQNLVTVAAEDGLDFRFDIARSGSTFDGHRVVHLAAEHGLQDAMKERLLRAYFTEGELIGDEPTLVRLAEEVGLDGEEVAAVLASERFADEVRGDERTAGEIGISAVPTFVINRSIGVSGAQPPEVLLDLLNEGWTRQEAGSAALTGEG